MWLKSEAGSAAKPQDRNGALAEENRPLFWVLEVDGEGGGEVSYGCSLLTPTGPGGQRGTPIISL